MNSSGRPSFGPLLKHWRTLRGLTQLALALKMETTTRHLSYLENARSRPGRDIVLRIGDALDLPLRARNELLLAAGLTAEFPESDLSSPPLASYRDAILRVIAALGPYPAFVIDTTFALRHANAIGYRLLPNIDCLPAENAPPVNLMDIFLAPGPAREMLVNFSEVAWSWHARFLRTTAGLETPEIVAVRDRLTKYLADVPRPPADASGQPVVCPTFRVGDALVRTIGMTMRFGPSRDVMLEELSVDILCPRDEVAEHFFRELSAAHS